MPTRTPLPVPCSLRWLTLVTLIPACSDTPMVPDQCFLLVASVTPSAPTVTLADTIRLVATYNDVAAVCLPPVPAGALIWRSEDPTVAAVDSLSGLVTAVALGTSQVNAFAPRHTQVLGFAIVGVTSP